MTILGGECIKHLIKTNQLIAEAGDPRNAVRLTADQLKIGPNSIDVTLGDALLCSEYPEGPVDPMNPNSLAWSPVPAFAQRIHGVPAGSPMQTRDAFMLLPNRLYLGFVVERFQLPRDFHGHGLKIGIDGRSTVGRMGVIIHLTAGYGDVGFAGNLTLELMNLNLVPLYLYPGMRIGQVSFELVDGPGRYDGAYSTNHDARPVPPVLGYDRFF